MAGSNSILIRKGRVLDPSQRLDKEADLLIENGKISAVEKKGVIPDTRAKRIIDAEGLWVLPGLIDAHVHLREPGFEHRETIESGTRAAAAGGFTSVACMANTSPVNDNPYITSFIRERAKQAGLSRVFPIGAVSKGLKGEELAEIGRMVEEGAVALSDDGMPVMNSYLMRRAMEYAKSFGVPVISHAEDLHLVAGGVMNEGAISTRLGLRGNPSAAEEIMVAREIALCRLTRCRVHIAHVTSELALRHIERAKEEGLPVTCEVTPHHLFLNEETVIGYDTCCKMAPPLRTEKDVRALRQGLAQGVIDMIATDHAPHAETEKKIEFDDAHFGVTGLESALALALKLVQDKAISLERMVEALTVAPARLIGQELGTLKKGRPADVTLVDPKESWKLDASRAFSKSSNTPFSGRSFRGRAAYTIVGGQVIYESETRRPRR